MTILAPEKPQKPYLNSRLFRVSVTQSLVVVTSATINFSMIFFAAQLLED